MTRIKILLASLVAVFLYSNASGQVCDIDADGDCDAADIDHIVDLSGDGNVGFRDVDIWLRSAGPENGFAGPYLIGDANLDGRVDATDLNKLGIHWQVMEGAVWSTGDFTADGRVDAQDLMTIGLNWQQSVPRAAVSVPEPAVYLFAVLSAIGLFHVVRRFPTILLIAIVMISS